MHTHTIHTPHTYTHAPHTYTNTYAPCRPQVLRTSVAGLPLPTTPSDVFSANGLVYSAWQPYEVTHFLTRLGGSRATSLRGRLTGRRARVFSAPAAWSVELDRALGILEARRLVLSVMDKLPVSALRTSALGPCATLARFFKLVSFRVEQGVAARPGTPFDLGGADNPRAARHLATVLANDLEHGELELVAWLVEDSVRSFELASWEPAYRDVVSLLS